MLPSELINKINLDILIPVYYNPTIFGHIFHFQDEKLNDLIKYSH